VGGLEDTITDVNRPGGYEFMFREYNKKSFLQCLERALKLYFQTEKWHVLMRSAIKKDFSKEHMASEYKNFIPIC